MAEYRVGPQDRVLGLQHVPGAQRGQGGDDHGRHPPRRVRHDGEQPEPNGHQPHQRNDENPRHLPSPISARRGEMPARRHSGITYDRHLRHARAATSQAS